MGYLPPENTARIEFEEGHEHHGMVLNLSLDMPANMLFDMIAKADAYDAESMESEDKREMYRTFGDMALSSWNVEDKDGEPVPATGDGLLTQSMPFVAFILHKWVEATNVDAPLDEDSNDTSSTVTALTG